MGKGAFQWDSEVFVGEVLDGEKAKTEIKLCTKNDKQFVSVTKWSMTNSGWGYPKGMTLPVNSLTELAEIFTDIANRVKGAEA